MSQSRVFASVNVGWFLSIRTIYKTLENDFLGVFDDTLAGTVRALVSDALGELLQTLAGEDVAARQDDGWVRVRGLTPADRADEDGVVEHALGERGLESQLVLRRPLRILGLVDACEFDEVREREGAGRRGHVKWRFS